MQLIASGLVGTILLILSIPLLVIVIVGAIALVALRMLVGAASRPHQSEDQEAEETRMIQDIYHGLQRMEHRVEALETILLEKQRKEQD